MWSKWLLSVSVTLMFAQTTLIAKSAELNEAINDRQIEKATWMIYSWRVLGWQYDSPYWIKGSEEKADILQPRTAEPAINVRAVCLGEEEDYYVFFTLRSFVDAVFPNLFVQGVESLPLDKNKNPFPETEIADESYIRYGGMTLVHYEDVGALHRVSNKVVGITHFDNQPPQSYGRIAGSRFRPDFYETIDNVRYENPHRHISASQHLSFPTQSKISIQYIEEHDIALIYIPKNVFPDRVASTLEMKNPTLSVKLMLGHNRELFGFKYVLIGQETLDMIKSFAPPAASHEFSGFQKVIKAAGLALGPETLHMLRVVDAALDAKIPADVIAARDRIEAGQLIWNKANRQVQDIVTDRVLMAAIRDYILPRIIEAAEGR